MTILLQRDADPSSKDGKLNTPLHYAAAKGWTSIAKKLMENGNTAGEMNRKCETPLELAIRNEHNECATFLVKTMEPCRYIKLL